MAQLKTRQLADDFQWFKMPGNEHLVQFYQSDADLLSPLAEYIKSGLSLNNTCLVIATKSHRRALENRLKRDGINIPQAQKNGIYVAVDAQTILDKFMVNGLPDRHLFFDSVGAVVAQTTQHGVPLRAHGEMVAVLWQAGNKEAVMALEQYWNELAELYSFSLYCAYPKLHFVMHPQELTEISAYHNVHAFSA